ncbi:hypothetical protein BACCAP_04453 [Pseudoflavonifractor capillosus ATCC 29799]|uniref:Uncharacterized protein n=1 Tax=Pseudoflavonifractor capillosus ATCC 29799 TaxID=411467 RepID=A6P1T1_9FIRM|nr:hypothetical protein [Pseudoflavonifractor capillosus]EDM97973.1 hypothetical protein BACCAP_04453 [Pseudoflavonifractor capillosus ATCC 29799]
MTKKGPEPGSGPFFTEILNFIVVLHRTAVLRAPLFCVFFIRTLVWICPEIKQNSQGKHLFNLLKSWHRKNKNVKKGGISTVIVAKDAEKSLGRHTAPRAGDRLNLEETRQKEAEI